MKRYVAAFVLFLATAGAATAAGLGVNVPLVGRLSGAGGTLFLTAIDVSNHSEVTSRVTFYLDAINTRTGQPFSVVGSIGSTGAVTLNAGSMVPRSNQHFDDFIDALVRAGRLPRSIEDDGVIGSVLFVFESLTRSGQGSVTARFYNGLAGGFVGVAVKGHEIVQNEPQKLIVAVRDSRGDPTVPQMYPNLFINNTGLTPSGTPGGAVTVRVSAVSARTGQGVGNAIEVNIGPGLVASVGQAFQALGVDIAAEDTILVTAAVTSGNAAIAGIVSQVDPVTRDGSAYEMSRAAF